MKFDQKKVDSRLEKSGKSPMASQSSDTNITHEGGSQWAEKNTDLLGQTGGPQSRFLWNCLVIFHPFSHFVCYSLLLLHSIFAVFLISSPLQSNQSGISPSQHPSTAQSCSLPHLPLVLSPLFYLYVLPVSISISSSRGTGPALWADHGDPSLENSLPKSWVTALVEQCVCVCACVCACVWERGR